MGPRGLKPKKLCCVKTLEDYHRSNLLLRITIRKTRSHQTTTYLHRGYTASLKLRQDGCVAQPQKRAQPSSCLAFCHGLHFLLRPAYLLACEVRRKGFRRGHIFAACLGRARPADFSALLHSFSSHIPLLIGLHQCRRELLHSRLHVLAKFAEARRYLLKVFGQVLNLPVEGHRGFQVCLGRLNNEGVLGVCCYCYCYCG